MTVLAPDPVRREVVRLVELAASRARAGDVEALRFLQVRYSEDVFAYVLSIVGDPHDAEAVTRRILAGLAVAPPAGEARDVPFPAWLLRTAHDAALERVRARRATRRRVRGTVGCPPCRSPTSSDGS